MATGDEGSSGADPYRSCAELSGSLALDVERDQPVRYTPALRPVEKQTLRRLVGLDVVTHLALLIVLLVAVSRFVPPHGVVGAVAWISYAAIVVVESIRMLGSVSLWLFSAVAMNPVPMPAPAGLRVAVLTTIVPGAEPVEMLRTSLRAMRAITYLDEQVDVWVLDEGDDPAVKAIARSLGVRHFSRAGRPEFNAASGRFRAKTKAGNHNSWFAEHGRHYDVVAQLDPDHIAYPWLLERTLGYFRDPDLAYVVAPQVYGDYEKSFPGRGAAEQAYLFHGVIQRGANGWGAPLLIGTNHVYRCQAWREIGGYQDCIIEDHLTSMTVHATINATTGRRWTGVYTPDVVAVGQAPLSWGDLFVQQRRWAQGATEIALRHTGRLWRALLPSQRAVYVLLQSFYPSVALSWVLGSVASAALILTTAGGWSSSAPSVFAAWSTSALSSVALFAWLRRLNLGAHERRSWGLTGLLTTLCTAPVYTAAVVAALLRRPLRYRVTPKGGCASPPSLRPMALHLAWAGLLAGAIAYGVGVVGDVSVTIGWASLSCVACVIPVLGVIRQRRQGSRSRGRRGFEGARPVMTAVVPTDHVDDVADHRRTEPRPR